MLRGLMFGAAALGAVVTMGCSDPAAPEPTGAAYVEVGPPSPAVPGTQCPHSGSPAIIIGKAPPSATDKGGPLTNEEDGATVECSVSGGKFSLYVRKSAYSIRIAGEVDPATGTGTANVTMYDPLATATLVSSADSPCTVNAANPPMGIKGDTAWGQFSCPALEAKSQPNALCAASVGYFFFDNCN